MARTVFKMSRVKEPRQSHRIVARNNREARQVMRKHYPQDSWFDERRQDREPAENFNEREVLS
jgi:hypothetical protein